MKKILLSTFILATLLSGFLNPLGVETAFAQVQELNPNSVVTGAAAPSPNGAQTTPQSTGQKAASADNQGANGKNPPTTIGCLSGNFGIPSLNLDACAASIVYIIMWIFSWFLWLAGKILDMSIYYTLNMADLMKHVPIVDIGWRIFRDLANILFIFILLWTAIGTILGLATGKTKEIIVNLVIVALLMNFSLFITKAVIDGSNIVALHFYNLIVTPNPKPNGDEIQSVVSFVTPTSSFSGAFMEGLKIQTVYEPQTAGGQALQQAGIQSDLNSQIAGGVINFGKIILIGIFGIILMITAAYVFIVAAILFIIRVVVLMMVMILSPLGFLSFVLPSTEHYAEEWKEKLISQSIFAPIYMALCYVVVLTIQTDAFKFGVMTVNRQDTAYSAASTAVSAAKLIFGTGGADNGTTAGLAFVFNFILLIGLMLGSIMVAHKLEATGVEFADEVGKEARAFVGRTVVRGTYVSAVGNVVGGAASTLGKWTGREGLKNFGDKFKSGAEKVQKNIDINELDKKFKRTGFGATELGSFIRKKTTGGSLFGAHAKFGGEESVEEYYEDSEKLKNRRFALGQIDFAKSGLTQLDKAREEMEAARASKDQARIKLADDATKKAESALSSAVTRIAPEDFADLDEHTIEEFSRYATLKQLKAVLANDHWTMEEKQEMIGSRWKDEIQQFAVYQKQVDDYDAKKAAVRKAILDGKVQVNPENGDVDESAIQTINGVRYAVLNTGEKIENPESKPPLPGNLKAWARNKMTLPEYELASFVAPNMFDIKELVHTMRWGLTNKEIRTNENFAFNLRDRLSYDKDSDMDKIVVTNDPNYIKSDGERDAEKAVAALKASKPTATKEEIEEVKKKAMEESVTRKAAFDAAKKAAEDAKQALLTSTPGATPDEISKTMNTAFMETYSKGTLGDTLRRSIALNWKSGRAANELAGARSRTRNSEIVHSMIDEGIFQQFKDKDSEDITSLFESLLKSYKAEKDGYGLVTDENRRLLKYLFLDPRSKTITRPIETLSPELRSVYSELENQAESPSKQITFASDQWRKA
jgi:hypothetical protein